MFKGVQVAWIQVPLIDPENRCDLEPGRWRPQVLTFPWKRDGDIPRGGGGEGGDGGALTLVLGTHCKTDSRSCGCRLEKRGLSQIPELSEGGLSEGHFLLGL